LEHKVNKKMISEKIKELSQDAKKLVEDVDGDIKSDAFKVVFRKLLDESYSGALSKNNIASIKKPEEKSSAKKGPKYHLTELKTEGFFEKPKNMKNILDELKNRTYYYKAQDLTLLLRNLVQEKILRRVEQKNDKDKKVLHWVNW